MAKLESYWSDAFADSFDTDEEVIEFIFERINTSDFEDSYKQMGEGGNPNTSFKITKEDKRQLLYEYLVSLVCCKNAYIASYKNAYII